MAKFQFSMEGALQYRQLQAEREQARLEELVRERDYWAWQDRQLDETRQSSRQVTPVLARDGAVALQSHDVYLHRAARQQRQILARRNDCQQRLEAQQLRVAEARRQVKLLEKLREKAYQQWQGEQDRQVEELAADVYLAKWNRDRQSGKPPA